MEYRLASSALIQNFPPVSFLPSRQSPICVHSGGLQWNPSQHGQSGHRQHRGSARLDRRWSLVHFDRRAANAATVTVSGSDGSSYQLSSTGGKQAVSPAKTTTYTATATGAPGECYGYCDRDSNQLHESSTYAATTTSSPAAIASGSSSTLSVSTTNATQVSITGSDGSSYTLPGTGALRAVSPTATTTYTATATGAGGSATADATVTVTANPPPTVTLTSPPCQPRSLRAAHRLCL